MSYTNGCALRKLHSTCVQKGTFKGEKENFDLYLARMKEIIEYTEKR